MCGHTTIFPQRAVSLASIRHDALPEELLVKEIVVTKGISRKVLTIMGKGRAGFGYKRWSHIKLKVQKINFDEQILKADSISQRIKWIQRKDLTTSLRASPRQFHAQDLKQK
jgi:hypothetical protein